MLGSCWQTEKICEELNIITKETAVTLHGPWTMDVYMSEKWMARDHWTVEKVESG